MGARPARFSSCEDTRAPPTQRKTCAPSAPVLRCGTMRNQTDHLAKRILYEAIAGSGSSHVELSVPAPDPQRIDLWHVPGIRQIEPPRWLRLPYRMVERPCLLEPSSRPPGPLYLRQNQRKQLTWHHRLCLTEKRAARP